MTEKNTIENWITENSWKQSRAFRITTIIGIGISLAAIAAILICCLIGN